jgi:DNA-binding HxlR family transcriptional regulator
VPSNSSARRRSGCPVSAALEVVGDRWSMLIVRDMMVRGYRTFREFQRAGEGIATNILADRLRKLEAGGILMREATAKDGRSTDYRLTEKGISLAPVLLELLVWGARHEETDAPCGMVEQMTQNRAAMLAEVIRRWEQRDATPLLPPFVKTQKLFFPPKRKSNSLKGKIRQ